MKQLIPLTAIAALAASGLASAEPAYSDPSGYTTTTIYGAFAPGSPKNNVIAPDLEQPAVFKGVIGAINGDVLTLTGASLADLAPDTYQSGVAYTHFVETSDGYWSQVVSNTTGSVTVEAGAGSNFTVGESLTVRPHPTISTYFGANNETDLLDDSITYDVGVADNILIIDSVKGVIKIFANNLQGGTWTTTDFEEAGNFPIYPDQGLQVLRREVGNRQLVNTGSVDLTGRQIEVTTGVQVKPFASPVETSLSDLNLYTGDVTTGVAGTDEGNLAEADIVSVIIDGVVNQYVYSELDLGFGIGWYTSDFSAAAPSLPAGSAIIINRKNPVDSSPFIWAIPALTVGE